MLPVPFLPPEYYRDNVYDMEFEVDWEMCEIHIFSTFMAAQPNDRPQALYSVLKSIAEVTYATKVLCDLDEDSPGFGEFLVQWRALLTERLAALKESGEVGPRAS